MRWRDPFPVEFHNPEHDPDYRPPSKIGPLVNAAEREARLEAERKRVEALQATLPPDEEA